MVDPVANEAMSQVTQVGDAGESGSVDGLPDGESDAASFQEVLDGKREPDAAAPAEQAADPEATDRIERTELDGAAEIRGESGDRSAKLRDFVEGISDDHQEIDRMLTQSLHGGALNQKELLEMQALIYSYSKKVELTSKVVEKGTGGLKQMMQMRV